MMRILFFYQLIINKYNYNLMQKAELQKLYQKKIKIPMLSAAGRVFQKQLMIDDIYAVKKNFKRRVNKSNNDKKQLSTKSINNGSYSPFKTISRDARDSYLLRVTYQPNVKTNYQPNYQSLMIQSPKYTLNKSKFVRRIDYGYQYRDQSLQEPSIDINTIQQKCKKSVEEGNIIRPLTVTDCMNWRKTFHHMDFSKQIDFRNNTQELNTTNYKTLDLNQLAMTKQSHFNNQKRFSLKPAPKKAHDFTSDQPHKYLSLEKQDKIPVFDLEKTNWNRIKRRWDGKKANLKFDKFRNQITVKHDRSEEPWNPKLQYYPNHTAVNKKVSKNVEFFKEPNRKQNLLPNKYPIKIAQRMDYGQRKYSQLKDDLKSKMNKTISI